MLDLGRPHGDLYEVALWEDLVTVEGNEVFFVYSVDNQAIVNPETIDAIRALCGLAAAASVSINLTDRMLGIGLTSAAGSAETHLKEEENASS